MNTFWTLLISRAAKALKDYLSKPSTYWAAKKYLEEKEEKERLEKILNDTRDSGNA